MIKDMFSPKEKLMKCSRCNNPPVEENIKDLLLKFDLSFNLFRIRCSTCKRQVRKFREKEMSVYLWNQKQLKALKCIRGEL